MPDQIGNITVPDIVASGTFPIVPDYPHGRVINPDVAIHQFGSGNAKIEQRFLTGNGAKRFTVRKAWLTEPYRIALRDFWESKYGPYGAFTYNAPNDSGVGTTAYTCRFADEPLSWEMIADWAYTVGVTLIEIPTTSPTYTLSSTVTRFPSSGLQTALLSQVQQLIPLIKIQPLQSGYPTIYLSDRRCTVGAQLYQARLLNFDGVSQSMGNEADNATFTFGNADRVMRDLANDVDLFRATLEFSLYHVGQQIKLDLWKGDIINWSFDAGPEFKVTAADGLYELNLPYPCRKISRSCWKAFNIGACPYSTVGALDLVHFPSADASRCDKGYDTPNGCLAHGMKRYYGAIIAEPQAVRIKDNSTGVWGFRRANITSVSLIADSIYDQIVPEIYTDHDMPVNCKIAAGRDEGDFYEAMGIVGEGPLTAYTPTHYEDQDGNPVGQGTVGAIFVGHTLDDQAHHGWPTNNYGLRTCQGYDPAGAEDWFSLDDVGNSTGGDWRKVYSGNSTFKDNFAAGLAFLVIRRSDAKGVQLSRPAEHQMQAYVRQGMGGWIWFGAGDRTYRAPLTDPVWIGINMLLRARGLRLGSDASSGQLDLAEQFFDVDAAVVASGICNESVTKLVGSGTETQFGFRGVLQEEKPLRDWLQEVLMNCLGYYTFSFGKLRIGVRENSSTVEAFTLGNILFNSLQLAPLKPSFNHLTANFADKDYRYVNNSVTVYDIDQATLIGGGSGPLFLKSSVNLAGSDSKSQAARIISVRLREELGGITAAEWKAARQLSLRTTVLALNTEPGMVCSMTHPDMPGGSGEFRVTSWKLNRDYSIDIQGRTTTDSMYDLVTGPKPADVVAIPPPGEPGRDTGVPSIPAFGCWNSPSGSLLHFTGISFADLNNTKSISRLVFTVYYRDRCAGPVGRLTADVSDSATSFPVDDVAPFAVGEFYQMDSEIIQVTAKGTSDVTVERGALSSTAGSHAGPKMISGATNAIPIVVTATDHGKSRYDEVHISGVVGNTATNGGWCVGVVAGNIFPLDGSAGNGSYSSGGVIEGTRFYHVAKTPAIFPVPYEYFGSPESGNWDQAIAIRGASVAAVQVYAENAFGASPVQTNCYVSSSVDSGLILKEGRQLDFDLTGTLAEASDAAVPIVLSTATPIRDFVAFVSQVPTGGKIVWHIKAGSQVLARLVIKEGETWSVAQTGRALDALPAGVAIGLDIVEVGNNFPGQDLVVSIRV